jgi:hypothetical protein
MLKGPSYRRRMAVQKKPVPLPEIKAYTFEEKIRYVKLRDFLLKCINMHEAALINFTAGTDEWDCCRKELSRYRRELKILIDGAPEQREEVCRKYGERIH